MGAYLITRGQLTFEDEYLAMVVLMLGAMGLGNALSDIGDQQEAAKAAGRIFDVCASHPHFPKLTIALVCLGC
jgi:hypothetical protein